MLAAVYVTAKLMPAPPAIRATRRHAQKKCWFMPLSPSAVLLPEPWRIQQSTSKWCELWASAGLCTQHRFLVDTSRTDPPSMLPTTTSRKISMVMRNEFRVRLLPHSEPFRQETQLTQAVHRAVVQPPLQGVLQGMNGRGSGVLCLSLARVPLSARCESGVASLRRCRKHTKILQEALHTARQPTHTHTQPCKPVRSKCTPVRALKHIGSILKH